LEPPPPSPHVTDTSVGRPTAKGEEASLPFLFFGEKVVQLFPPRPIQRLLWIRSLFFLAPLRGTPSHWLSEDSREAIQSLFFFLYIMGTLFAPLFLFSFFLGSGTRLFSPSFPSEKTPPFSVATAFFEESLLFPFFFSSTEGPVSLAF